MTRSLTRALWPSTWFFDLAATGDHDTMPHAILMPALLPDVTEGKLARWLVSEGAELQPGDVVAEVRTDKASLEVEAHAAGRLERILVPAGTAGVRVGSPLALLRANADTAIADEFDPAPLQPPPAATEAFPDEAHVAPPPRLGRDAVVLSYREAVRQALAEEMRRDPDVFMLGEEIGGHGGAYRVSDGLIGEFGARRIVDTPITEQGFTGLAVGAAFAGLKPVVEFMTWNFAMQAIDHIVNSAAKTLYMSGGRLNVPIVFRGPNGPSPRAGAQHAQCLSAWLAHVPGLKVVAPACAADALGLVKAAIRDPNPVVVLEHERLYATGGEVPHGVDHLVPIGVARIARAGRDVTLVSYSCGVQIALQAAEALARDRIEAEVIDLRSLRPLDIEGVLASVRKTHRVVVVEESWPVCSVASEIAAQVAIRAFDDLDAPPAIVAGADVPMPYAENLERLALPTAAQVVAAARSVLYA